MKYKKLFAGCVRQAGDEVHFNRGPYGGHYTTTEYDKTKEDRWSEWTKVKTLHGHTILQSDLMVAEFRRPI